MVWFCLMLFHLDISYLIFFLHISLSLILCFYWFHLCVYGYICVSLCYFCLLCFNWVCFYLPFFLHKEKEGIELEGWGGSGRG